MSDTQTLTIDRLDTDRPFQLMLWYPDQSDHQKIWLALDLETGQLCLRTNPRVGDGVPESVHHSRTVVWALPYVPTAGGGNQLLEDVAPIAARLLATAVIEPDGDDIHVGRYDDDLYSEIATLIGAGDDTGPGTRVRYPTVHPCRPATTSATSRRRSRPSR